MKKIMTIVLLLVTMMSYSQDSQVILDIKGMCSMEDGETSFTDWEEFNGKIILTDEKITFYLKTNIVVYVIGIERVSDIKWEVEALDPDIGSVYANIVYDEGKNVWFVTMVYDKFTIMYVCDFVS